MINDFKEKCANAINHSWKFSWYWPQFDWEATALEQAELRREELLKKVGGLSEVIGELRAVLKNKQSSDKGDDHG